MKSESQSRAEARAQSKAEARTPSKGEARKAETEGGTPLSPGESGSDSGPPLGLRWFLSRTLRHANQMRKHVWKILSAQRDLLPPQAVEAVTSALQSMDEAIKSNRGRPALMGEMNRLEKAANKWLRPYPFPAWRENVDVLLVAIAVALGVRTFFLQPFKIPTGSMQPTLYGITSSPDFKAAYSPPMNAAPVPDFDLPNPLMRFLVFWTKGISYTQVKAKTEGAIQAIEKPWRFLLFNIWQRFQLGGEWYTVWFPTDDLMLRAGLVTQAGELSPRVFKPGDDVIKIRVASGDHLFVDRVTYNFRRPHRGEIIVFQTQGVFHPQVPQDQYYIKRLVALGNDRVSITDDQHLRINGQRLDTNTPNFERVYSFTNGYSGHVPDRLFAQGQEFQVRPNYYLVMGDNTRNSLDSRYFGDFSREFVIGRAFFVYWPFGAQDGRPARFGCGNR